MLIVGSVLVPREKLQLGVSSREIEKVCLRLVYLFKYLAALAYEIYAVVGDEIRLRLAGFHVYYQRGGG